MHTSTKSKVAYMVWSVVPATDPLKNFPGVKNYENSIGAISQMYFASVRNNNIVGIPGYPFQQVGQTHGLEQYFHDVASGLGTTQDYERDVFACYVDYPDDHETIAYAISELKRIHNIA